MSELRASYHAGVAVKAQSTLGPQIQTKETSRVSGFFWKLLSNSNKRVELDQKMAVAVGVLRQVPFLLATSGDGIIGFGLRLIRKEASSNE